MADKELKLALKDAVENIKKKDYEKALKDVKRVLNKDKNNYKALIFCGLCFAELGQHDKALQVGVSHLPPGPATCHLALPPATFPPPATFHLSPSTCPLPPATCHLPPGTCPPHATWHLAPGPHLPPSTCHLPP